MVNRLVIARHAEAFEPDPGAADHERALTPRGERMADEAGRWLIQHEANIDRVIASPAVRARETARRILEALGFPFDRVRWVDAVYSADVPALVRIVEEEGLGADEVLLVGHNPGLQGLVHRLAGSSAAPRRLPPGGIVRIRLHAEATTRGAGVVEGTLEPQGKG